MNKLHSLTVVMASVFLFGFCSPDYFGQKTDQLNPGMTKQEVIKILGIPESRSVKGSIEYLRYCLRTIEGMPIPYFVRLVDGKVESFGREGDFAPAISLDDLILRKD